MMRRRPLRMVAGTALVAGTATAVSGRVARRQQNKYADQDAQAQYEAQAQQAQYAAPPPPPAAAPPVDDTVNQIQQIAGLHAQGVLTDEEFAAKKAQILGI